MEGLIDQPLFNRADYLSFPQMKDGQGLNALLQNYWMVIHPPVLFLGFASTIVPFSYAIAGLLEKTVWTMDQDCPSLDFVLAAYSEPAS